MKLTRLVLLALTVSLAAACGSDITGPESTPQPSAPSLGWGTLGSGT